MSVVIVGGNECTRDNLGKSYGGRRGGCVCLRKSLSIIVPLRWQE